MSTRKEEIDKMRRLSDRQRSGWFIWALNMLTGCASFHHLKYYNLKRYSCWCGNRLREVNCTITFIPTRHKLFCLILHCGAEAWTTVVTEWFFLCYGLFVLPLLHCGLTLYCSYYRCMSCRVMVEKRLKQSTHTTLIKELFGPPVHQTYAHAICFRHRCVCVCARMCTDCECDCKSKTPFIAN